MKQSELSYFYELDPKIRDTEHHIGLRADPNFNSVESFAAILFFTRSDGTLVEIAKIDNSPHEEGGIHIDRYYRELGAEIKDFDIDIGDWAEAENHLKENWVRFARLYHQHHGLGVRGDRANA